MEPLGARRRATWAIKDRVPLNQAGLFSGEGGTGKSIIELMKNVAHVSGKARFPNKARHSISAPKTTRTSCTYAWPPSLGIMA